MSVRQLDYFWIAQPPTVKLFLIGLSTVFVIALVRFVRLARSLSRSSDTRFLPENILKNILNGSADPDRLATAALQNQELCSSLIATCPNTLAGAENANTGRALHILRMAESRFVYLWEQCDAEARATKRASLLTLLLSSAMVTYSVYPVLNQSCNNNNTGGYGCLLETGLQLTVPLGFGLSLCALLYLGSSFFERRLAHRRTSWKYLSSLLRNGLSHE
jgi:hypothetical protein